MAIIDPKSNVIFSINNAKFALTKLRKEALYHKMLFFKDAKVFPFQVFGEHEIQCYHAVRFSESKEIQLICDIRFAFNIAHIKRIVSNSTFDSSYDELNKFSTYVFPESIKGMDGFVAHVLDSVLLKTSSPFDAAIEGMRK